MRKKTGNVFNDVDILFDELQNTNKELSDSVEEIAGTLDDRILKINKFSSTSSVVIDSKKLINGNYKQYSAIVFTIAKSNQGRVATGLYLISRHNTNTKGSIEVEEITKSGSTDITFTFTESDEGSLLININNSRTSDNGLNSSSLVQYLSC